MTTTTVVRDIRINEPRARRVDHKARHRGGAGNPVALNGNPAPGSADTEGTTMLLTPSGPEVQGPQRRPAIRDAAPANTTVVAVHAGAPRTANAPASFTAVVKNAPREGVEFILREIGPTTLVALHPDTRPSRGQWLDETTVDTAADWVERQNQAGFNIYFTVNLPTRGLCKKAAKVDIEVVRGAFADIDAKGGRTMDDCLTAIERLVVQPNIIVMSGGGYQPIWLFDQPLPATAGNVLRAECIAQAIAGLTGGDNIQHVDRILRLPFTVNYPNAVKRAAGRAACLSGVVMSSGQ